MFFFQAEDGIRDLVRSRGLGDVYKRQAAVGKTAFSGDRPDHALSVRIGRSTLGVFDLGTHLSLIHI